jgi:hypothetical protein
LGRETPVIPCNCTAYRYKKELRGFFLLTINIKLNIMGLFKSLIKVAVHVALVPLAITSDTISKGAGYRPKATKTLLNSLGNTLTEDKKK